MLRQADNGPEEMLWEALRDRRLLSLKFRRQQPLGPFIVDFYCADLRLAVEVDGGIHSVPAVRNHDTARDEWLSQRGVRVIRISADGILGSLEETLTAIADAARRPSPL
ncbi:MAG: endonuclease domain-containing protein, partial [Chloroflexi bacterium]|nr:endonuclease domain-containing protein [Chloroflexota bacterium]